MSIRNPNERDFHLAGLTGMDPRVDTEIAEDLGIPSTPETYLRHVDSGASVAEFGADALEKSLRATRAREADHAIHAQNNRLSGTMSPEKAAMQAAINARHRDSWQTSRGA